jgi:hypothetical protein
MLPLVEALTKATREKQTDGRSPVRESHSVSQTYATARVQIQYMSEWITNSRGSRWTIW